MRPTVYLGADDGRLMVQLDHPDVAAGLVDSRAGQWRDGYLYSRLRDDPPGPR